MVVRTVVKRLANRASQRRSRPPFLVALGLAGLRFEYRERAVADLAAFEGFFGLGGLRAELRRPGIWAGGVWPLASSPNVIASPWTCPPAAAVRCSRSRMIRRIGTSGYGSRSRKRLTM